jgi:hypothetical protein
MLRIMITLSCYHDNMLSYFFPEKFTHCEIQVVKILVFRGKTEHLEILGSSAPFYGGCFPLNLLPHLVFFCFFSLE